MKWKLKTSTAQSAKFVCVIRVNKNNLTGEFMSLNNLGNGEYSYSPESIGIYRVMNNIDRSANAVKGCYLVYQVSGENFLRYMKVTDEHVKNIPSSFINDSNYISNMAAEIKHSRMG